MEIRVLRKNNVAGRQPEMAVNAKQRIRSRNLQTAHTLLIQTCSNFVVREINVEGTGFLEVLRTIANAYSPNLTFLFADNAISTGKNNIFLRIRIFLSNEPESYCLLLGHLIPVKAADYHSKFTGVASRHLRI